MSGSKQDIGIKIFGDDLNILSEKAAEVERIIQAIAGVEDINVEKITGLAQIQVEYDRERLAQYGLTIEDVNLVLRTAFAGSQAGVVFDEEKRFGLVVRLDKDYRQDIDDVKNLTVAIQGGQQIPFDQLADISIKSGPAQVSRENTKRRITIGFNVRNRDVQSVINDAMAQIDQNIQLPVGYYISYGGQFKNLQAAQKRLSIAVPVALILIFVMLFFTFNSAKQSLLIFTAVPMSAIGGVFALWLRGMNFSISAGVGFIALFGVAVLNGIVLIAEFNRLEKEGVTDIMERVRTGLRTRLRPVILTAAVASFGFLPMALSTSAGAEVQKPLATVVIGGLITATLLTLLVLPVFYIFFSSPAFRIKRKLLKTITAVLLLMGVTSVFNQVQGQHERSINLDDAIKMALDSNLSVKSAAMSIDMQKALKGASFDIPKTAIDGQYGRFNSYSNDNSFVVSQSIAFPSVYINKYKLADANIKSSELQHRVSQLEIATLVKQVYWQLAYLSSRHKLLNYQDSLFSGLLRAAELRARAGETNRLEMITARSQSLEIKNQIFQTVSDIEISRRKFTILLNTSLQLGPTDAEMKRLSFTLASDSAYVEQSPFLEYVKQQVEVSERTRKLERSQMMPDLSFGYFSQTMIGTQEVNGVPTTFGSDARFAGIQAGISIPIWFPPYTSRTKAAKISENIARNNAENYTKSIYADLESLLDEYNKYNSTVDYYETQAVPEANLIIEQATMSFKAGGLDYLDYVLSVKRALEIRQNYLDALNSLCQTIISIEYITGKIY
jgi:cobalt-zinc-cadmium resistance protein CzcA